MTHMLGSYVCRSLVKVFTDYLPQHFPPSLRKSECFPMMRFTYSSIFLTFLILDIFSLKRDMVA